MRFPINLASQPHENLRPVRTAVVAAAVIALALGALLLNRELRNRNEFRMLIQQQADLELALRDLRSRQQELEAALSTPEAQQARDRSGFMNSLILRKSLSWTQLFMDLEDTLPARARVTGIHPRLNAAEDVDLELTIAAASLEPLVEFLKNLEASQEFGAPLVGSQRYLTERSSESGIELALTTRYAQNRSRNLSRNAEPDSSPPSEQQTTEPDVETPVEEMAEATSEEMPGEAAPREAPDVAPEDVAPDIEEDASLKDGSQEADPQDEEMPEEIDLEEIP